MRINTTLILFITCISLFSACKTTRKIVETPSASLKIKGEEVIQVFDSVKAREFSFHFLSSKAEVSYTDKTGETNTFDINLRMRSDSAIWISITPLLGIEVARVLISHDSIILLDRIHKTYMKRDYKYFEDWLNTKVNYDMLQAVIVGNYFQYVEKEKLRSIYEEEPYIILSTLNKRQARRMAEEKDPNKPLVQDFWIDGNYRIARSKITDEKKERTVEALYKNFSEVNGHLFPTNILLTINEVTQTIIQVDYKKVENSESLQMPFFVPEKYQPR